MADALDVVMMPLPPLFQRRLAADLGREGARVRFVEGFYPTSYLPWWQLPREVVRGYDVFHVHWVPFWNEAILWGFLKLMPRHRALAWTFHNLHPHAPHFRDDLAWTRRCFARADVRFVHSEANVREFGALGMAGARVVPLANLHGAFRDEVDRVEARERLGLDEDAFVVGFFGPTGPYKGAGTFLDALARVPEATGLLFGACPDPAHARELRAKAAAVGSRARLDLRRIPDDEMQHYFRSCDVVALPYERITTSGSVFFPAAFGVPVVASPLGNLPDVVQHGRTGWLAEGAAGFASAFGEALRRKGELPAMGARFREDTGRRFDGRDIARLHVAAYREAVEAVSPP